MDYTQEIVTLLNASPSPFHVIVNMETKAKEALGEELVALEQGGKLVKGKTNMLVRNGTTIALLRLPKSAPKRVRFCAAHSDSPSFKLKPIPLMKKGGDLASLNVEPYGGMLMAPWFDRPLSFAGRVVYEEDGEAKTALLNVDEDLLVIPNLCIHMNREANSGHAYNPAKELIPLFASKLPEDFSFDGYLQEKMGISGKILAHDLFLYVREPVRFVGKEKEFMMAPRLDDLSSAYACLLGFLNSQPKDEQIDVYLCFDNEEVGSLTKQGANSTFLRDLVDRIGEAYGLGKEELCGLLEHSFMMSVDNAHANHPNYPEISDPTTVVKLNGGVVLKYNANAKYTTDALSAAFVKMIANDAGVPYQEYTNRSDMRGGSTLGNLSNMEVSLNSADIGMGQLAMHSPIETQGVADLGYMVTFIAAYYSSQREPLNR